MLHHTIESLLERGEKLDTLVEKSEGLSLASRLFLEQVRLQRAFGDVAGVQPCAAGLAAHSMLLTTFKLGAQLLQLIAARAALCIHAVIIVMGTIDCSVWLLNVCVHATGAADQLLLQAEMNWASKGCPQPVVAACSVHLLGVC